MDCPAPLCPQLSQLVDDTSPEVTVCLSMPSHAAVEKLFQLVFERLGECTAVRDVFGGLLQRRRGAPNEPDGGGRDARISTAASQPKKFALLCVFFAARNCRRLYRILIL